MYTLIVGNIGKIGEYASRKLAFAAFAEYVELSKSNYGRVAGEPVYLFENNEIVIEHDGELDHAE
jgi:hypothetical protein